MNYKKVILLGGVAVIVGLVFFVYVNKKGELVPVVEQKVATTTEPQKTDFGASVPADFPSDIPVEKGIKFEQSYALNYVGQRQLTIVFLSSKTVKENYSLYADFLKKQNWNISNKYESAKLSSLYGTKGSNDINVTISEDTLISTTKSQVSISVLKK